MHEWALAEEVISTSLRVAKEKTATGIVKIKVKVGELQRVDEEVFESALKELAKGTLAEGAKMEIEPEKAILKCTACGHEWTLRDSGEKFGPEWSETIHLLPDLAHAFIRCPGCDSRDFKTEKGCWVWVDSIQIRE